MNIIRKIRAEIKYELNPFERFHDTTLHILCYNVLNADTYIIFTRIIYIYYVCISR